MAAERHDDMFQHLHIERSTDRGQPLGCRDIGSAGRGIAARMIVDEDDRGGVEFDRPSKYGAWIEGDLSDRSMLQLFVGDQSAGGVEKENAQRFVRQRPHRGSEIFEQTPIAGVDPSARKLGAQRLRRDRACGNDHRRDRAKLSQRAAQGFGRLGEKTAEGPMFCQQRVGYGFAVVRIERGNELSQDGSLTPRVSRRW